MIERLPFFLLFYPLLLFSLSCHEAAHAWSAARLGDPTAKSLGRISLNPLRHMDMIGTFFLPVISIFSGIPLIGWGKPVPVDGYNLKNPRRDTLWISLLGPVSNLVLAFIFAIICWVMIWTLPQYKELLAANDMVTTAFKYAYAVAEMGVTLNLALAFFNLIPLYPLDGGGIIRGLLPDNMVRQFDSIARYGMIIIMVLLVTGGLKIIFFPVKILANLLLPV